MRLLYYTQQHPLKTFFRLLSAALIFGSVSFIAEGTVALTNYLRSVVLGRLQRTFCG